ncbi:uncharacterized protein DUF1186 [Roseiarcus fermentans]|uniref:Uncharacterized protein DUF1186 n=1 Tax=Roseiarcus fermentans TaxID=1473586 RepID=A0A366EVZ4_9HYPH|nr:DUF1186 domain-containing protein [Roseiarcus fermentans]RBP06514.1 uncharacterized protein DUF1186 [Roseiarcus fermentans]
MNVDEALRQFGASEAIPREAMVWALANWETASPRFIARLRAFASGRDRSQAADGQAFYLAHLCGQMRETRAYAPLCRLIADDPDLEIWLGDAIGETLPGILINVSDGDTEPLLAAIESAGDEAARGAALMALGYLARSQGVLDDVAMRDTLRRLRREAGPREPSIFWVSWAGTAAALGYDDLKMEVAILAKEGLIEVRDFGLVDFEEIATLARGDAAGLAGFDDIGVRPLDDAIATLEAWAFGDDGSDDDANDDEAGSVGRGAEAGPSDAPYLNPLRDVGRNDPCPCGSGKKYKKCCLAA